MTTTKLKEYLDKIQELERKEKLLNEKAIILRECKRSIDFLVSRGWNEDATKLLFGVAKFHVQDDIEKFEEEMAIARANYGEERNKLIQFGFYEVSLLGVVLANLISFVEDKNYEFKIEKINEDFIVDGDLLHTEYISATFEQACLQNKEEKIILFESAKPGQCDASPFNSTFKDLEYLVHFESGFEIPYESKMYNWPEYLGEFMLDLTNYRMIRDLYTINKEEMVQFLQEFIVTKGVKYKEAIIKEKQELAQWNDENMQKRQCNLGYLPIRIP